MDGSSNQPREECYSIKPSLPEDNHVCRALQTCKKYESDLVRHKLQNLQAFLGSKYTITPSAVYGTHT